MNRLYVLVGVAGSGKSTWIKNQIWALGLNVVSTDSFVDDYARAQGKTYSEVFEEYMPTAVKMMVDHVLFCRENKLDIIWDQTSCSIATRKKKIDMLPEYYKIAVVFKTPSTAELIKRLESRPGKEIPWSIVSDMAQKLETEPPTIEEGFNEIWYAH